MNITIARATINDYPFLKQLEHACFDDNQKSSPSAIKTSLSSPFQRTFIAYIESDNQPTRAASLIVHLHKHTLRLYSIAVMPQFRSKNIGQQLMQHCISMAIDGGFKKISLEAMTTNTKLIRWYEAQGFKTAKLLPDYYTKDCDANRMILKLDRDRSKSKLPH